MSQNVKCGSELDFFLSDCLIKKWVRYAKINSVMSINSFVLAILNAAEGGAVSTLKLERFEFYEAAKVGGYLPVPATIEKRRHRRILDILAVIHLSPIKHIVHLPVHNLQSLCTYPDKQRWVILKGVVGYRFLFYKFLRENHFS